MRVIDSTAMPVARTAKPLARPARMPGLDLARLIAAYAIIWLHAPHIEWLDDSRALGRFGVPLFVMITILMVFESLARNPQQELRRYARSRFVRLYLPFMAWNGIYLAFKLLKGRLLPGEPNDYPGVEILWVGACWHLWFLPFILVVSLLAFAVARFVIARPESAPRWMAASLLCGWVLMFFPPVDWLVGIGKYGEIVGNALPPVAWGLGLAIACQLLGTDLLKRPAATLLGGLLLVAGTACVWRFGHSRLCETLAGLGMLIIAMAPVEQPWCRRLAGLGTLAYGIYLSHVLWLKVIEVLAVKAGMANAWPRDAAIFLAAALASSVTAWLLSRRPSTRWLVA